MKTVGVTRPALSFFLIVPLVLPTVQFSPVLQRDHPPIPAAFPAAGPAVISSGFPPSAPLPQTAQVTPQSPPSDAGSSPATIPIESRPVASDQQTSSRVTGQHKVFAGRDGKFEDGGWQTNSGILLDDILPDDDFDGTDDDDVTKDWASQNGIRTLVATEQDLPSDGTTATGAWVVAAGEDMKFSEMVGYVFGGAIQAGRLIEGLASLDPKSALRGFLNAFPYDISVGYAGASRSFPLTLFGDVDKPGFRVDQATIHVRYAIASDNFDNNFLSFAESSVSFGMFLTLDPSGDLRADIGGVGAGSDYCADILRLALFANGQNKPFIHCWRSENKGSNGIAGRDARGDLVKEEHEFTSTTVVKTDVAARLGRPDLGSHFSLADLLNLAIANGYRNPTLHLEVIMALVGTPLAGDAFKFWADDVWIDIQYSYSRCVNLLLGINGSNDGSVTQNPPPNCAGRGAGGDYLADPPTPVQLTAVPNRGVTFGGWGGAASGNSHTVTVLMNSDKVVYANFDQCRVLTIVPAIPGVASFTRSPDPNCPGGLPSTDLVGMYRVDTPVVVTARERPGPWYFDRWFSEVGPSGVLSGSLSGGNPITVQMDRSRTLEARFGSCYGLQIQVTPPQAGRVTVNPPGTCAGDRTLYRPGEPITVTAVANPGFQFERWYGAQVRGQFSATATLDMTFSKRVEAHFLTCHSLTLRSNPAMGNNSSAFPLPDCPFDRTKYRETTRVDVFAPLADTGFQFQSWDLGVTSPTQGGVYTATTTRTVPSAWVLMSADRTVTANFSLPSISISDVSIAEGNQGTTNALFTVTLSFPSTATVSVAFSTADGTAVGGPTASGGTDYLTNRGTLNFPPGTTRQTITVGVIGDTAVEPDETFFVNLTAPTNAVIAHGQAQGTIKDDDTRSIIQFSSAKYTVAEGAPSASFTLTRTLASPTGAQTGASVGYTTRDGTAKAGADYRTTTGIAVFRFGESTKVVAVPIIQDNLREGDETVILELVNPDPGVTLGTPSSAVLTITDDDPLPSASINDVQVKEGNKGTTSATFKVTLSGPSALTVVVRYATQNGTAISLSDYYAASGKVTFAPGTTEQSITITVVGDTTKEKDETFLVVLVDPSGAVLGRKQGQGTIINDD